MKKLLSCFIIAIILTSLFTNFCFAENVNIDCEAGILLDANSGKVLFEKNADKKMYPASITKILTAILVVENCDLNETAVASEKAIMSVPSGYTTANIQIGEAHSVKVLLSVMLIPSANDAANVLAEHVAGSIEEFAVMMNEKAKEIGCQNSNFVNPSGIHNKNHYTTARDMALIGNYAMKNSTIRSIVNVTNCALPDTDKYTKSDRVFTTTNELLTKKVVGKADNYYYQYCTGIKTGYTAPAGNTLVASASRDGNDLILVLLKGGKTSSGLSQRYLDAKKLFDFGFNNFSVIKLQNKGDTFNNLDIPNDKDKISKQLEVHVEKDLSALVRNEDSSNQFLPTITMKSDLKLPIKKGDVVGEISYTIDDITYSSNLISNNDISKFSFLSFILKTFWGLFKVIIILALIFIVLTIVLNVSRFKKRKKEENLKLLK